MEKYKELYDLSLKVFHEQHETYDNMTEKASKFITVLTLLIGVYTYLGKMLLDSFLNETKTFSEWILIIIGFILFLILIFTWFILLKVLKLRELLILPFDDETIKFFDDNRLIDIYYALSKGVKEAIKKNQIVIKSKSDSLAIAYKLLYLYTFLFLVLSVFYLIVKWFKI